MRLSDTATRLMEYLSTRISMSFDLSDPNTWTSDCSKSTTPVILKYKAWQDSLRDLRCYRESLLSYVRLLMDRFCLEPAIPVLP